MTGIRENFLQFGIGQEAAVFLSLVSSEQVADQISDVTNHTQNGKDGPLPSDVVHVRTSEEKHDALKRNLSGYPNPISCEIYLQHILHENVFMRAKEKHPFSAKTQASGQSAVDGSGLVGHFCMTLAHRIFSNKVLAELEKLVMILSLSLSLCLYLSSKKEDMQYLMWLLFAM